MFWISVLVERGNKMVAGEYTYSSKVPIAPGIRVKVPFGKKVITGIVTACLDQKPQADFKIKPVESIVDSQPIMAPALMELARWTARTSISPLIDVLKIMLPQGLKPLSEDKSFQDERILVFNPDHGMILTPGQKRFLSKIEFPVLHSKAAAISTHMVSILKKKGVLKEEYRIKDVSLKSSVQGVWPKLNDDQKKALHELRQQKKQVSLLYGVTGSGKTEVFFHLIQDQLDQGNQVLLLVPEIALTPMMKQRIVSRFNVPVYEYHSRLTPASTLAVYKAISQAGPCVVLGTRKACFLPFKRLGLMILDEEHDASYQNHYRPAYHAREVCIHRLNEFPHARVILSSATPCLETAARAWKGIYGLSVITRRARGSFCKVQTIDLNVEESSFGLTRPVVQAISNTLRKNRQAILLLNRRGYIPKMQCLDCKSFMVCPECNLPLSWHKKQDVLVCHTCGNQYPHIKVCPVCGSSNLRMTGIGTEKLEEHLQHDFPSAHLIRMDRDTTSMVNGHEKLFKEFEQDGDILVGTQMVAKGIDFPRVDLTAVIGIDNALFKGEFRAQELAYQLAEQAAGRAGRGFSDARVLIQTYFPGHYIFEAIRRHDYWFFFKNEMKFRKNGHYPPYTYLVQILVVDEDEQTLSERVQRIVSMAETCEVEVLGPLSISMRQKHPRCRILLKDISEEHLIDVCWSIENTIGRESWKFPLEFCLNPVTLEE